MKLDIDTIVLRKLQEHVGLSASELELIRSGAIDYLDSANAKVRLAALALSSINETITQNLAERCEELARKDPDPNVRGAAVSCVGGFYQRTSNRRIAKLLAGIVRNETERADVRWVAYSVLASLGPQVDLIHAPRSSCKIPQDVDWEWVDSFLI